MTLWTLIVRATVGAGAKVRLLHPSAIFNSEVTVAWEGSRTIWVPALDVGLANIWFYATRMVPVYKARVMNEEGWFHPPLPSLGPGDMFFYPKEGGRRKYRREWHQNMQTVVTGGEASVVYAGEEWHTQWSPNNQVCFKSAVFTGATAYVVSPSSQFVPPVVHSRSSLACSF